MVVTIHPPLAHSPPTPLAHSLLPSLSPRWLPSYAPPSSPPSMTPPSTLFPSFKTLRVTPELESRPLAVNLANANACKLIARREQRRYKYQPRHGTKWQREGAGNLARPKCCLLPSRCTDRTTTLHLLSIPTHVKRSVLGRSVGQNQNLGPGPRSHLGKEGPVERAQDRRASRGRAG